MHGPTLTAQHTPPSISLLPSSMDWLHNTYIYCFRSNHLSIHFVIINMRKYMTCKLLNLNIWMNSRHGTRFIGKVPRQHTQRIPSLIHDPLSLLPSPCVWPLLSVLRVALHPPIHQNYTCSGRYIWFPHWTFTEDYHIIDCGWFSIFSSIGSF